MAFTGGDAMHKISLMAAASVFAVAGCATRSDAPTAGGHDPTAEVKTFVRPVKCGVNIFIDEDDAVISVDYEPVPTRACAGARKTVTWRLNAPAGYRFAADGVTFKAGTPAAADVRCRPLGTGGTLFSCDFDPTAGPTYLYTVTVSRPGKPDATLDPRIINN
jgi:hypothetical protein